MRALKLECVCIVLIQQEQEITSTKKAPGNGVCRIPFRNYYFPCENDIKNLKTERTAVMHWYIKNKEKL